MEMARKYLDFRYLCKPEMTLNEGSVENAECGVRSAECGKCGVWKMRSVENVNMKLTKNLIPLYSFIFSLKECFIIL